MNKEEIKQMIPYTDDFLLIDGIKELTNNQITAIKTVTDEDCRGHFRDFPIFPGVKTVEGMAQAASILVRKNIENHKQKHVLAYKANNTKFTKPAFPRDRLTYKIDLIDINENRSTLECKAFIGDTQIAQSTITLAIIDKREFEKNV